MSTELLVAGSPRLPINLGCRIPGRGHTLQCAHGVLFCGELGRLSAADARGVPLSCTAYCSLRDCIYCIDPPAEGVSCQLTLPSIACIRGSACLARPILRSVAVARRAEEPSAQRRHGIRRAARFERGGQTCGCGQQTALQPRGHACAMCALTPHPAHIALELTARVVRAATQWVIRTRSARSATASSSARPTRRRG